MRHAHRLMIGIVLVVAGCGTPPTGLQRGRTAPADGGPIQFNLLEVSAESRGCAEPGEPCARVKVLYPETTGGGTAAARDNVDLFIRHLMVSRMRAFVPEGVGPRLGDVESLAAAFLAQFRSFVAEFPDATADWSIEITADAIYSTAEVITLDVTEFAYTGGAHPNSRRRLASFDIATGRLLGADDLTNDIGVLTSLVEDRLRTQADLGPGDDLEAAGFWLPETGFALPDNLGVTAGGLLFHWDAYEIAPFSMGSIDIEVPAAELESLVSADYW